jgi:hypothetical protein
LGPFCFLPAIDLLLQTPACLRETQGGGYVLAAPVPEPYRYRLKCIRPPLRPGADRHLPYLKTIPMDDQLALSAALR